MKYQGEEHLNLHSVSCRPRLVCEMAFTTLCLTTEVASLSLFLDFSVAQVLMGLRKQFVNNFVFPTWACAAGFNNNNFVTCNNLDHGVLRQEPERAFQVTNELIQAY